ncbi:MAG: hypothetical protein MJ152_01845, partial [Clostridia bacterium]|nr:hypothetical protein [Clostridia bacterium]
ALFVISILAFAVSILFTIITEGGSNVILLLTGLEVIFVVLFSQNLCKKRRSICLLAFVFALAIAVAVFKSLLFDPKSQNVLSTMFNIWSNVVTSLTLALCYLVDVKRQRKLENQKVETETKPSNKKEPK